MEILQRGGSTTVRDLLERAKQKKAEQDQADDTPQPVCVFRDFLFESSLVCVSRFMVVSAMSAQHGDYPACGRKGWEINANVLFLRFCLPPCVAEAKREGCERNANVLFKCPHVPIYSHYAGYLGVIDLIFGTSIAPSSSWYSLDVFTQCIHELTTSRLEFCSLVANFVALLQSRFMKELSSIEY